MKLFKPKKKELDSKSIAIAVMYLDNAKYKLEKELEEGRRDGEDEVWAANHDIECLERTINYLRS
ncbi:hypothetical protein SAMN05877753_105380 [Bacillus oleivorans]|uniref:Uncharacterized protein n=1 Tax=Bacillus oleivorans TaxID=1448271 RepID=A0A285CW78_9BACI|nr:hypothetical protein [Bacillus oleivorans]SNX71794.1 hypothetical protein SAMN05877753_105380 [Bacillus oleivorans]